MSSFRYFDQLEDGKFLKIESDRLDETIKFIEKENIENIYVSRSHGYKLDNIEPLLKLKGIKKFQYQESGKLISMSGIENLSEIEYLRIDDEQKVDLSAFPNLKFLIIKWSKKIANFNSCDNLQELNLWNFNTKERDFTNFPSLKNLKTLNLFFGNADSLNGLQLSNRIKNIEFHRFPKLTSIDVLTGLESLEFLFFQNCKRIQDFDATARLTNLKTLAIIDCGEIENLNFLKELDNLTDFRFVGTTIKNGDLRVLVHDKFKYIGFDNKKHYSHKYEELKPLKK